MATKLTRVDLEELMEEAARTLRRLPNPAGSGARGYGNSWPDHVREAKDAYGYHDVQMKVIPNAAEIARMEECLGWLRLVDPEDARIIWSRASGDRWRSICIQAGCVRQTAFRRWVAALETMARRINAGVGKRRAGPVAKAAPRRGVRVGAEMVDVGGPDHAPIGDGGAGS